MLTSPLSKSEVRITNQPSWRTLLLEVDFIPLCHFLIFQDQLEERLQFVKPPDESVASWFYDYAAIEAATGSLESAKSVLKRALDYGYPSVKVDIQNKP